jgi:hypothetical protein
LIASLRLPEDAIGDLEVWDSGNFIANFPLNEGCAKVTLGDLKFKNPIGKHRLLFSYVEEDYYVENLDGELNIVSYEFKKPQNSVLGRDVTYFIDFHNKNVSGILKFCDEIIDEFDLIETFDSQFNVTDGICNITLSNLRLGAHNFFFDFNDYEIPSEELWVYPPINVKDRIVIGQDSFFTLDLNKNASGEVIFTLYNEEEDTEDEFDIYYEDGEFEISSAGLVRGHYDITSFTMIDESFGKFSWEDSPNYDDEAAFISFNATYPSNTVIVSGNAISTYTDGKVYKARVMIGTKAVEGARVVFKINGKVVKRTVTDEDGFASFKISKTPGSYKLTIIALGKTVTKKLTVKDVVKLTKVSVRKSASMLTLTATLAKINGKYLKKKTVNFKFNGVKYKATTNSKGVAKVIIPKQVLAKLKVGKKVTYQATYLKDTVKKTVKVSK